MQYIKYLVNKEVAERFFRGEIQNNANMQKEIAEKIIPGPKALFRCCIYKERHIIEERVQVLFDEKKEHVIRVLDSACEECPIDRFVVTEACRGCLGHKCQEVCPRNAITVVNQRAYINQNLCIECGRCKEVCPFNAISEVMRPCMRACSVGAVQIDEDRKAFIDRDKCISCGTCIYQCPFGAIIDQPFILEILRLLNDSWNNTSYHVYAVVSAAVSSQFTDVTTGQVFAGIKELGFYDVMEAAVGADMVILAEIEELQNTIQQKEWEAASYCPAFVKYIQINYPQLMDHVSTVVSPMVATARAIREKDPKARIVYIGSCAAKKEEIHQADIQEAVDYVLTFEELQAVLDAKQIILSDLMEIEAGHPSSCGRAYGRSGGISESICQWTEEESIQSVLCNGMDECIKKLKLAAVGRLKKSFLEGIACKGGCTGGTASLSHDIDAIARINHFSHASLSNDPRTGIGEFRMKNIQMNRNYCNKELHSSKQNMRV